MRTVRLTAAGHPAVTGRHDKTLELTAAAAITARATCILAVSAGPLPGELPLLRERVRLTLAAGGVSAAVEGEVNPGWHSAESLVVEARSPARSRSSKACWTRSSRKYIAKCRPAAACARVWNLVASWPPLSSLSRKAGTSEALMARRSPGSL